MESAPPPDRPPGGEPDPTGPQSPAPGPPPPQGPQSPAPGYPPPPPGYPPQAPQAPQYPPPGYPAAPGYPPPSPGGPYAPPGPEGPPGGYTGPVPPGGWQQPAPPVAWAGAPLAGWGQRAGALLLDAAVVLAAAIVLLAPGVVVLVAGSDAAGIILLVLGGLGYLLVVFLYAPYFMQRQGARNGQTLGKQWVGIRVMRDSGESFTWGSALLREFVVKNLLFAWVGGFFASIPTLLDYLWPLWDDQNRALHDMVVSTHVVKS